ncbi:ribosomal RNA large subunit methyltransferase J [Campylobacter geochelonis]|uniref:Ribosomal RNA large subunit methyltransferase J n=2 Tax=Campylobacter geochelonis TaxID=1780362 RepID=A0A128EN42_9BACT|nr:ribosomal RNA large subunit methyltransferase J [Campylobacter geochelonis]CZE47664.1 ribosomal RNA large subunit methyltransferase J [Campylobacter geochelonis]CZE50153.1 ribosomal RNA large subunit methyltransferase J [Campylobacter geochelonis]
MFVANALNISRNKASQMIKDGKILLDGEVLDKASSEILGGEVLATDEIYVSRAALKLKGFLQNVGLEISGKTALDIGSSTGGFVQILLENGAKSVVALDVGSMQLDENLRNDTRVKVLENTDIREFKNQSQFDIVTCDVSFISLNLILSYIEPLFKEHMILLFKPQFEVGKEAKRNKSGVVVDKKAIERAMAKFELKCASLGLLIQEKQESQIKGKEGNSEYFYLFKKAF